MHLEDDDPVLLEPGLEPDRAVRADQPEAAALVIDWLLSPAVQADIPLNMFVFPARDGTALPEVFERFAPQVPDAEELSSEYIANNIDEILSEWSAVMGR